MSNGNRISGARFCAVGLALALMLLPAAAFAKSDKAHGKGDGPGAGVEKIIGGDTDVSLSVSFGSDESRIIQDYFGAHPTAAKPLPPGIAKNLARGKPLPPGIAKRYLPQGLLASLPPRQGYERLIVGNDVVMVSVATGLVVDILVNALH